MDQAGKGVAWRREILLLVPSLLGAVLILVSTGRYGIGVSPDSVGYIAAARSLASGHGLALYDGRPLVEQPPLYPGALALGRVVLRADPLTTARSLGALFFGLAVYLGGRLALRRLAPSILFSAFGVIAVLLSRVHAEVAVMAWTEPLFVCLTLLFLLAMDRYDQEPTRRRLVIAAAATALACLTRYLGITLVATGAIFLLLRGGRTGRGLKGLGLFLSISLLPFLAWIARNYAVSGSPLGERSAASFTLLRNLHFTWRTIAFWILPNWTIAHRWISTGMGAVVVALLVLGIIARARKEGPRGRSILGLFVLVYLVVLIYTSTIAAYDRIGDRLLAPVFVPLILLVLRPLRDAPGITGNRTAARVLGVFVAGLIAVTLVSWGKEAVQTARYKAKLGGGVYNPEGWWESPICSLLRQRGLPGGLPVYSNAPDAVYFFTGVPVMPGPTKGSTAAGLWTRDREGRQEAWPERSPAYLVWFQKKYRKDQFAPEEIQGFARVEQLERVGDGAIFIVRRN